MYVIALAVQAACARWGVSVKNVKAKIIFFIVWFSLVVLGYARSKVHTQAIMLEDLSSHVSIQHDSSTAVPEQVPNDWVQEPLVSVPDSVLRSHLRVNGLYSQNVGQLYLVT